MVNVSGVVVIKFGQQLAQPWLGFGGYLVYFLGFFVLSFSFKYLEMGLVYALWSGAGSLLVLACGVLLFKESLPFSKLIFFAFVMLGVCGLSLSPQLETGLNLKHMLSRKFPWIESYLLGFSVLTFWSLKSAAKKNKMQDKTNIFIQGSLTATLVMSLMLVCFLMLLQNGLTMVTRLFASATLWLVLMVMMTPGKQDD